VLLSVSGASKLTQADAVPAGGLICVFDVR